jgi:hypothetical protein
MWELVLDATVVLPPANVDLWRRRHRNFLCVHKQEVMHNTKYHGWKKLIEAKIMGTWKSVFSNNSVDEALLYLHSQL